MKATFLSNATWQENTNVSISCIHCLQAGKIYLAPWQSCHNRRAAFNMYPCGKITIGVGSYLWVAIYVTAIFKDPVLLNTCQEKMLNTIALNLSSYTSVIGKKNSTKHFKKDIISVTSDKQALKCPRNRFIDKYKCRKLTLFIKVHS